MTFPREDFRNLAPYRPESGQRDLDLSDNTNLWGPHPDAVRALQQAAGSVARYPSGYGDHVRETIRDRYDVPLESVTTGCGSDDLLDAAFRSLASPGDTLTYLTPTFSMVPQVAVTGMLRQRVLPVDPRTGVLPDPSSVLASPTGLVYLCTPNNPTGRTLPREWMDALLAARARMDQGPIVLIDEAYSEFAGQTWITGATARDWLLVTRTLSKAYGLAGLRVGYAVGHPRLIHELNKARGPFKVGNAADLAAAAALRDESRWLEGIVQETLACRSRLLEELRTRGWDPLPSDANFVLIGLPPQHVDAVLEQLTGAGILVRPVRLPDDSAWIRVTVGPWPTMARFLTALGVAP